MLKLYQNFTFNCNETGLMSLYIVAVQTSELTQNCRHNYDGRPAAKLPPFDDMSVAVWCGMAKVQIQAGA